jgi:predicted Zn-dependent protease
MELGQLQEAADDLEALLKKSHNYPQAHYFLGETYGKLGQLALAHYNLGLHYLNKGDRRNALFHLTRALKDIQDPAKKQEIEEILRKIKEMPPPEQSKPRS